MATCSLSFDQSDLIELCERFGNSQQPGKTFAEQKRHVYDAINYAARSIGRFDLQVKEGQYIDGLAYRVYSLVTIVNTCSAGGHEVYISSDGYKSIRWEDYGL